MISENEIDIKMQKLHCKFFPHLFCDTNLKTDKQKIPSLLNFREIYYLDTTDMLILEVIL